MAAGVRGRPGFRAHSTPAPACALLGFKPALPGQVFPLEASAVSYLGPSLHSGFWALRDQRPDPHPGPFFLAGRPLRDTQDGEGAAGVGLRGLVPHSSASPARMQDLSTGLSMGLLSHALLCHASSGQPPLG